MSITTSDLLRVNYDEIINVICKETRSIIINAKAKGVVVGLSGGIDSTVTVYLMVKALGKDKVLGLIMPYRTTPKEDIEDALEVARILGIKYYYIDIISIRDAFTKSLPDFNEDDKVSSGNLLPRIRMTILYYYANRYNLLVAGTSDKSELLLGYFTKYGDGGVDFLPIGDLYKTQVRYLGKVLEVPEKIINKPSSPRLWTDHLAEVELGLKYEIIDLILYTIFDLGMSINEASRKTGIDIKTFEIVLNKVRSAEHKRSPPKIIKISNT